MTLLTEALRAQIGRTATYTAPDPLGRAAIRYYAVALGDPDPDYANGSVAPPTLICETNQHVVGEPDEDGYLGHSWGLVVPNTLAVRGGNEYTFHAPVGPDTVLTARWTLTDIVERQRGDGTPMLIVSSEARYVDQYETLLAVNRETIIHLGLA